MVGALSIGTRDAAGHAPLVQPAAAAKVERWYDVSLAGKHAGYQHEEITTEPGAITTRTKVVLVIKRGVTEIHNTIESTVVENDKHEVVSMSSRTLLGSEPITAQYVFDAGGVAVTRTQQGNTIESKEKRPEGAWLSPQAAQKFIAQRRKAGAKEFSVMTLDPASGLEPSTDTYTLLGPDTVNVRGKEIKTWKYRAKAGKPKDFEQTVWLDENGETVRSEADMGGMTLVTMISTLEAAKRASEAPEIMVATFIKPKGEIADPRRVKKAEYTLATPGAALPDLPTTGTQTFTRRDTASATVVVDAQAAAAATKAEAEDPATLKATSWANCDDKVIKSLTEKAIAGVKDADAWAKAEAIRAYAGKHISKKDLSSGFATASEVARTASGDCTEHALLCAAMLRAAGIPSRAASGLVFADQFAGERKVFAYHMWTQALLERDGVKRWVDLDATLQGQSFDATHLTLVVTTLKDGEFETSMSPISKMLGRLTIEVVKAQ